MDTPPCLWSSMLCCLVSMLVGSYFVGVDVIVCLLSVMRLRLVDVGSCTAPVAGSSSCGSVVVDGIVVLNESRAFSVS